MQSVAQYRDLLLQHGRVHLRRSADDIAGKLSTRCKALVRLCNAGYHNGNYSEAASLCDNANSCLNEAFEEEFCGSFSLGEALGCNIIELRAVV